MKEKLISLLQDEESLQVINIVVIVFFISAVIVVIVSLVKRYLKNRPKHFDALEGHEFEYYCAELLQKNGFVEVEVTKGSGDYGADILAEKDGVTYAIQCKCYTAPIGVKAIQEAHAGRPS